MDVVGSENCSIICSICARGGSKGVKSKNIRPLLGKPLIAYTIEQAKMSELFEHVIVSTDSDEIAAVAERHGAEVFFRRPGEMATSTAAKVPVIRHALLESERHFGKRFEVLVDLGATAPLRDVEDIRNALRKFLQEGNDNLFSVTPSKKSPYFNIVEIKKNGRVELSKETEPPVVRRQDAPPCYEINGAIYIWGRRALIANDILFLPRTSVFVMPEERSVDIDTELDFLFVEFLMNRKFGR